MRVNVACMPSMHAPHHVVLVQFLEQGDLAYGSARHALLLLLKPNLLERVDFASVDVLGLVHDAIRALAHALQFFILCVRTSSETSSSEAWLAETSARAPCEHAQWLAFSMCAPAQLRCAPLRR